MARPAKTATVINLEKKSHITKRDLAYRAAEEDKLLAKQEIAETEEVKADPVAHQEFLRVKGLLEAIGKNDEIYGEPTRRYCIIKSRLKETDNDVIQLRSEITDLKNRMDDFSDLGDYYKALIELEKMLANKERMARQYRDEMNYFEKENAMTIKAALGIIPKKPEEKTNSLREALGE